MELALKRAFDVVISGVLVVALFPLFIGVAIGIKLLDSGPVLFKQKRLGKSNKEFLIYKFRSMTPGSDIFVDANAYAQAAGDNGWEKAQDDLRITRFGKLIRRGSLDELPQLFNVLKGDMSLVGPRPLPPLYLDRYEEFAAIRSRMRPGITGLWQTRNRTDTRVEAMEPHDTEYILTFSLWLDMKILIRTLAVVFASKGAC